MFVSYIYLSIFFLLFSSSSSDQVENDVKWTWHKTKYLTRSNWTSSLKANDPSSKVHHPVWFIFNYLSYCGFCKKAEPGWEAAAQYAAGKTSYNKNTILIIYV
jgi:hypothetical protein